MKIRSLSTKSLAALVGIAVSVSSLSAQIYVPVTNLVFSEDFNGYDPGTLPPTIDGGGVWGTASWVGPEGFCAVTADTENVFTQGATNRFLQAASTRNLNLTTPTFLGQDVLSFAFDYIGHYYQWEEPAARWLNVMPRIGTAYAHYTSIRNHNATIRTALTDVPPDPSIGGLDVPVRVFTIMNNRADSISYDRPDGLGTTNLNSHKTSLWIYHYTGDNAGTWEHLIPEYIFAPAITNLGRTLNNVTFHLDNNAALRSLDLDNIEIHGSRKVLPPAQVAITNRLFVEDFQRYEPGTLPTTVDAGGVWGTATWTALEGSCAVTTDEENAFTRGTTNRFLRAATTRALNLTTPTFAGQEVLSFAFDYIGRFLDGDGTARWLNVMPRIGTGATSYAHYTSIRTHDTTVRTATTDVPPNPSIGGLYLPVRVLTIMNNREGEIIYDRPDGLGTTNLAMHKTSLWVYYYTGENAGTWVHLIPEYIYAPATVNLGNTVDSVMFQLDNNTSLRSLDLDNIEVWGTTAPVVPPIVLTAARAGGEIEIRWAGRAGKSYQVRYRNSLNSGTWENLGAVMSPVADGEQLATDSLAADTARFYQVVELPSP